ncbi:MAG: gamma carbonic anhydrase family protein [Clostridiales bacterium]|nr:gamma carbonic anhydrase family protein [Clostridiales bacterium]
MLVKPFSGHAPAIHPTVRGAENAVVTGEVTLSAGVSLWYGAVLRGDADSITVGENTNIQDNAVLHCDAGIPCQVGRDVSIGHGAVVHSARVGDRCLIGMNATLLSGCSLGEGCIVGGGAVVAGNVHAPAGSLLVGVPARVVRPVKPEEADHVLENGADYLRLAEATFPAFGE